MVATDTQTTGPKIRLELWEKIFLQNSHDGRDFAFLSRVVEQSAKEILIEYPVALEGGGVLLVGDWVKVSITRCDAMWAFTTKVTKKLPGQNPRMVLAAPRTIERNQRRRFVRVDYFSPCQWRALHPPEKGQDCLMVAPDMGGSVLDLSAGGLRLAADDPPEIGQYLIMRPSAADWPLTGSLFGCIVWKQTLPENSKYKMQAGMDFRDLEDMTANWKPEHISKLPEDVLSISPWVRQSLMRFVYHKQIELRNKGLL